MGLKARVTISLKPGVLDAQGKAVAGALTELGFPGVREARVGKIIELDLDAADPAAAEADVKAMCEKLLANSVIETYQIQIAG
jgi:phosphoribosylformylglycinamidine synthase